jgi:hypothetical protein
MVPEGHKAAGETEQMPAEKPPSPEYSNLEDLMGYLSTTERKRKQELSEQQRNATLEQRARSEEWYLRTEVCFILDPLKKETTPVLCCAAPIFNWPLGQPHLEPALEDYLKVFAALQASTLLTARRHPVLDMYCALRFTHLSDDVSRAGGADTRKNWPGPVRRGL